jgi:hypothetical protein
MRLSQYSFSAVIAITGAHKPGEKVEQALSLFYALLNKTQQCPTEVLDTSA